MKLLHPEVAAREHQTVNQPGVHPPGCSLAQRQPPPLPQSPLPPLPPLPQLRPPLPTKMVAAGVAAVAVAAVGSGGGWARGAGPE